MATTTESYFQLRSISLYTYMYIESHITQLAQPKKTRVSHVFVCLHHRANKFIMNPFFLLRIIRKGPGSTV